MAAESRTAGLSGGGAPRPPARPPRPAARPAGAPPPAGGAGAGGRTASAATTGARSASVDHRSRVMVSPFGAGAPLTVARNESAAPSADAATAPHTATMATAVRKPGAGSRRPRAGSREPGALLPITVVGPFDPPEPFHEPFELLVFELGPTLAHVHGDHTPAVRGEPR